MLHNSLTHPSSDSIRISILVLLFHKKRIIKKDFHDDREIIIFQNFVCLRVLNLLLALIDMHFFLLVQSSSQSYDGFS